MNKDLQSISDFIQQSEHLSDEEKKSLAKSLKDANKEFEITSFKLDRTEKVKRTTAILLEETIEELEKKRKAVEAQNKELEIESSLERVRTVAMSMNKPDDMLHVCRTISEQLELLKVTEIRNVQTAIFYKEKGTYMNYEYYAKHQKTFITDTTYTNHEIHEEFADKMLKGNGEFMIAHIKDDELKAWIEYQKTTNVFIDDYLYTASSLNYYWFSLGPVALGISTYVPLSDEQINLFKRFLKVFELSYRRYLDIEKAEAQAREAQIEAALEQVRSRSLAMHKSEDIIVVARSVFEKLDALGVELNTAFIIVFKNDSRDSEWWLINRDDQHYSKVFVKYTDLSIMKEQFDARDQGKELIAATYFADEKNELFKYLFTETDFKYAPPERKKYIFESNALTLSMGLSKKIGIQITRHINKPFSDEENEILKRFTKVFDQSYTRFQDLQKAEAQAREAQIEAALERVRAIAMSMMKPDDLLAICKSVYTQLPMLGFTDLRAAQIYIRKDEEEKFINYDYSDDAGSDVVEINYNSHPYTKSIYDVIRKAGDGLVDNTIQKKELDEWKSYLYNTLGQKPEKKMEAAEELHYYLYSFGIGAFGICTFKTIDKDELEILKRFRNVFSLSYQRYSDIALAESQARESQIELSLERVRAKTMAMHNSQDVGDTVAVMFDEVVKLGIETIRCGIGIMHEPGEMEIWTAKPDESGKVDLIIGRMDMMMHPLLQGAFNGWRNKQEFYTYELMGDDLIDYFTVINNHPDYPVKYDITSLPSKIFHSEFHFPEGTLFVFSLEKLSAEASKIFKRFAGVFGQTYRRYLDLKKAEAQARSAQIEAAMEKVRARSLAMQKPEELIEVAEVLRKEMGSLGVEELETSSIYILDDAKQTAECWYAIKDVRGDDKKLVSDHMIIDLHNTWVGREMLQFYSSSEKQVSILMQGEHRKEWINYCAAHSKVLRGYYGDEIPERIYHLVKFSNGYMGAASPGNISTESWDLLQRATAVFSFAYTRFQDLQKAEAQTKEAQIELALERVRARTMAMFKSDELAETAAVLFHQLVGLGIMPNRLFIGVINDESGDIEAWSTNEEGVSVSSQFVLSSHRNHTIKKMYDGWKLKKKSIIIDMHGKELENYFHYINEEMHVPFTIGLDQKRRVQHIAYFSKGFIGMAAPDEQSSSTINLLERFASVFNLTYTRFTDLQQAEAQAMEARIEASLERVRSKAMAMHSSEDLTDTIIAFYRELESLSVTPRRCGVGLINKETHIAEISSMNTTEQGDSIAVIGNLDLKIHPVLKGIYDNWILQKDYYPVLRGSEIKEYYQILTPQIHYPDYPNDVVHYGYFFFFAEGGVYAWTEKQMTENELKIYKRFTSVLTLTYKRYKDLKQAEQQAREATIEAALERVRGKAMAMRNSVDLSSAASMVFTELRKLGINPIRSGVGIISKQSRRVEFYSAMSSANGDSLSLTGGVIMTGHQEFEKQYDLWLRKENYFVVLKGEELKSYYKFLSAGLNIDSDLNNENDQQQYGHWLMFSEGFLFAWSDKAYSEAEINILDRFKKIVELTFRRYIELQKSEINAREAVKQAALDRVRADIASMRTTKDLEKITPLIWNELTILGIPFIRCGVFIMDEQLEQIHTFLSTPDGKAIAAFHIPYDTPGNINQVLSHWQQKENYIDHWDEKEFADFADTLMKQGALASPEQYLQTIPHGGFHLHFLPFLQGMLYVGNSKGLGDEEIKLIQSVADAFSTAYARYEDFNKLEAAKQTVEKTLTDLKLAQAQLVQSEKMASLGELTAGIAHEIQNPLNFVNNFSEVSNELIEELKEERNKAQGTRDEELENDILNDIAQNLEKINHHGKRADAIVKGMLQHSRSSTNAKEPTDINALADEYLRLAYHGLRGKDKSFNAIMKTDFDPTIDKISIIPQDIGRVLLNLYTNAFYAVNERKKERGVEVEPTVSISTKKSGNQVSITVSDNGNGIPQKIVDKIFQPFFTTKPTGQGTGLGLSLTYDIVKAHGGEIKVETKVDEGSTFIILIPINNA